MISPGNSPLWSEVLNSPADVQLAMFRQASAQPCADDVKTGFRAFAADLFAPHQRAFESGFAEIEDAGQPCVFPIG